jgi:hypothetical protein
MRKRNQAVVEGAESSTSRRRNRQSVDRAESSTSRRRIRSDVEVAEPSTPCKRAKASTARPGSLRERANNNFFGSDFFPKYSKEPNSLTGNRPLERPVSVARSDRVGRDSIPFPISTSLPFPVSASSIPFSLSTTLPLVVNDQQSRPPPLQLTPPQRSPCSPRTTFSPSRGRARREEERRPSFRPGYASSPASSPVPRRPPPVLLCPPYLPQPCIFI